METVGQKIALRAAAIRKKYGQYPLRDGSGQLIEWPENDPNVLPLPGHAGNVVPDCPDFVHMKEREFASWPLNREDWRRRFRPTLPRYARLDTYARRLHQGEHDETFFPDD